MKKTEKWYHPFDSAEEYHFDVFVKEMTKAGHITSVNYHPESLTVTEDVKVGVKKIKVLKRSTKVTIDPKTVVQGMVYTLDWEITLSDEFIKFGKEHGFIADIANGDVWINKTPIIILSNGIWYVDVKGNASRFDDGRHFRGLQKMVYRLHNKFPQKIVISPSEKSFFDRAYTPDRYLSTDMTMKPRSIKYDTRGMDEWLGGYSE